MQMNFCLSSMSGDDQISGRQIEISKILDIHQVEPTKADDTNTP